MSKNWFDQHINKKLSGTAEEFDLDANWKAIQAKRSKKKRRVTYFWLVLPAMIILIAGGRLYLATDRGLLKDQEIMSSELLPLASSIIKTEKSAEKIEAIENSELKIKSVYQTLRINDSQNPVNPAYLTTEIEQSSKISNVSLNIISDVSGMQEMNAEKSGNNEEFILEGALNNSTGIVILPLESQLQLLPESATVLEIPIFDTEFESKKTVYPTHDYWIGVNALYGLQTINRSGPEDLYSSRQNEEEALDMFQAGFEFGVKINKRLSIQTGLNFMQFTDKRDYQNTEVYSVIDSNFLISKILKADGSMQDIYGVAEIPYVREINETSYNRYRHMEIPVILAWENKLRNNFTFRAGAGVSLGLISSRSGSISDHLNAHIPLSQSPYKSHGQLAALIRIEWMYTKPGWSAGIIMQGRSDLLNQLKSNAEYTERRTAYAFGMAYRIHL